MVERKFLINWPWWRGKRKSFMIIIISFQCLRSSQTIRWLWIQTGEPVSLSGYVFLFLATFHRYFPWLASLPSLFPGIRRCRLLQLVSWSRCTEHVSVRQVYGNKNMRAKQRLDQAGFYRHVAHLDKDKRILLYQVVHIGTVWKGKRQWGPNNSIKL